MPALIALIILNLFMNHFLVTLQMVLLPEGLITKGTLERPLVYVNFHVPAQVVRPAELLATYLANLACPGARHVASSAVGVKVYTCINTTKNNFKV